MNIIFDQEYAKLLSDRYTVLELDTVMQPKLTKPLVLWAVIEITNLNELSTLAFFKDSHATMVKAYKDGNWSVAIELAKSLLGKFNGEVDEFYQRVIDFCEESVNINRTWDGILHTIPSEDTVE